MQVSTVDAKNGLSALLDAVSHGHEVTITKRGVPVAKLVPATPSFDREHARRVVSGLRQAAQGATLDGIAIQELVNDGRR